MTYSRDRGSKLIVISAQSSVVALDRKVAELRTSHQRLQSEDPPAARACAGVIVALQIIREAGSSGITYAALQMQTAERMGRMRRQRPTRELQEEIMQAVEDVIAQIKKVDRGVPDEEKAKLASQAERTKPKGSGSR